jgi:hypothetical protein
MKKTEAATLGATTVRRIRNAPKLERARAIWRNPDYTVDQIATHVGLSRRTLYLALGPRWETVATSNIGCSLREANPDIWRIPESPEKDRAAPGEPGRPSVTPDVTSEPGRKS